MGLLGVRVAHAAEMEPVIPAGTTTYAFVAAESMVIESQSQQAHVVEGWFDLTVDLDTGAVVISHAEARATADEGDGFCLDVDALFELTAVEGRILADGTLEFWHAGRDVDVSLTVQGDSVRVTAETGGRIHRGDYTLEALAWRQHGGEVTIPDGRSTYVFLPDQSTLLQVGGWGGIRQTDLLAGRFKLEVDLEAGTGSFISIDAGMVDGNVPSYGVDPNAVFTHIFNVTQWVGTVVNESTIYFNEETPENSCVDVILTLTFDDDQVHLVAEEVAPRCIDWLYSSIDAIAQRKYGGGAGEPNHPYLIYTPEQMNAVSAEPNDWDKHFTLMADIDLAAYSDTEFNIIGVDVNTPFTGVFDGNGHIISNFRYTSMGTDHIGYLSRDAENIGLFGTVDDPNATIRNLGLEDPNVSAPQSIAVGALVGYLRHGELRSCYVTSGHVGGLNSAGCLVGRSNGTITSCYATGGGVTGNSNLGGLVGFNTGTIAACHATSDVDGAGWLGGLVGCHDGDITACYTAGGTVSGVRTLGGLVGHSDGTVTDCYATDSVFGSDIVGGLVGHSGGTIRNCYAVGSISGSENVGGLLGRRHQGQVVASFWDIETTGQRESAAGQGKTTLQMQTALRSCGPAGTLSGRRGTAPTTSGGCRKA